MGATGFDGGLAVVETCVGGAVGSEDEKCSDASEHDDGRDEDRDRCSKALVCLVLAWCHATLTVNVVCIPSSKWLCSMPPPMPTVSMMLQNAT